MSISLSIYVAHCRIRVLVGIRFSIRLAGGYARVSVISSSSFYCAYYLLNISAFQESHTKNQNVSVR